MNRSRILLLAGAFSLLLPLFAGAQATPDQPPLDGRSFTRDFGGRSVRCQLTARASGDFSPGRRAYLQLDLDSTVEGQDESELLSAVVVNGLLAVAFPPGIEPDGQPRLMYFDEAKGSYQFMYSKTYPRLPRLAGTEAAMASAGGGDPASIFAGLATISQALDPGVTPVGPAAPKLTGGDPAYAVTGVSWLIPCNVYFKELVNLFNPAASLSRDARLRISLALKVTEPVANPRVAVYLGGLSAAVAKVELAPGELPPTALPLVPLPEAAPAAGAAQPPGTGGEAGVATPPQDDKQPSGEGKKPDDGKQPGTAPPINPEGQDEEPVNPADPVQVENEQAPAGQPAPPAPPEKIPALIYSYEWISWETELDLTPQLPAKSLKAEAAAPGEASVAPGEASEPAAAATPEEKSVTVESLEPAASPGGSAAEPAQPPEPGAEEGANSEPPSAQPAEQPESESKPAAPPAKPAAREKPASPSRQQAGVREVAPGTLPEGDETYSVPLKEITGGGAGPPAPGAIMVPQGPGPSAVPGGELPGTGEMVLVPEGYFLMGTGANSSAGDSDEQPQTQVYLPAYYIDKYPVSNRQFMEFVLRSGYKPEGKWDKYYAPATIDLPVREVSWNDAAAYAKWAGKRLPTEAEWEKAARGDDGRTYPWGEEWSADILPRGEMLRQILIAPNSASPYGVLGMCGLLWQWTGSAFAPYPFNPDAKGDRYVLRGGCFSNGRNVIRCANRYDEPPNVALNTFSFRCAKDAKSP